MATATLQLLTPKGHPFTLSLTPDDDGEQIKALMERTATLADWFSTKGYAFADAQPTMPSPRELTSGPTFAGFPCSPTTDDRGCPTWILVGDRQAQRREKQGDIWYSYKNGTEYVQALQIPKGEKIPEIVGLPA